MTHLSLADQCLVHRYLYYVESRPIISDWDYSQMEAGVFRDEALPPDHPMQFPGSERAEDYPEHIVTIAKSLL